MKYNIDVFKKVVDDCKTLSNSIEKLITAIQSTEQKRESATAEIINCEKSEQITTETVRACLSQRALQGKRSQVKALINKFGVNKLTDIDNSFLAELYEEAKLL